MAWTISYYSENVEQTVFGLPSGILARYLRLTDLMQEFGPNLGMPHTRSMGDGLFELRIKGREGISRVFFSIQIGQKIVMLHCFIKKTQKTPQKELAIARRRLKELKNDP